MVKEIIIGDDLIDDIQKYDVILIGSGIYNSQGNGFQKKMCINFPDIDKVNKETNYADVSKLGTCQIITSYVKQGFPIFVLCYINKGNFRPDLYKESLSYEALENCLKLVDSHFKNKKIGTTLLGNAKFEGNGDAEKIYEIIGNVCNNNEYYIYDYIQKPFNEEYPEIYNSIKKEFEEGKLTSDEFYDKKYRYYWKQYFGQYLIPYPEGLKIYEVLRKIKEIKKQRKNLV